MSTAPTCPDCGFIHTSDDARVVGRFNPRGPAGYHAAYDGAPLRPTRAEAESDQCARRRQLRLTRGAS